MTVHRQWNRLEFPSSQVDQFFPFLPVPVFGTLLYMTTLEPFIPSSGPMAVIKAVSLTSVRLVAEEESSTKSDLLTEMLRKTLRFIDHELKNIST